MGLRSAIRAWLNRPARDLSPYDGYLLSSLEVEAARREQVWARRDLDIHTTQALGASTSDALFCQGCFCEIRRRDFTVRTTWSGPFLVCPVCGYPNGPERRLRSVS